MQAGFTIDSILDITGPAELNFEPTVESSLAPESLLPETVFELGAWLTGLESFARIQNHLLAEDNRAKAAMHNWLVEFRLTHSTLLHCSKLTNQLIQARQSRADLNLNENAPVKSVFEISPEDLYSLANTLKDLILRSEALLRAPLLRLAEWKAWSDSLSADLKKNGTFQEIIRISEKGTEDFLPETLRISLEKSDLEAAAKSDLKIVFTHIAGILKLLNVIGKMISRDLPLKPALLLYARIYEKINELISFINRRLHHFPDETSELFGILDGVAYVASIELRKVYQQELVGLTGMRPVPLVRARIEASHGLLNDSFQQTLYGFARFLNPSIELFELFPGFKTRYEETLVLRRTLHQLMHAVRQAEQNPDNYPMDSLNQSLIEFTETTINYLMYKDWDTFERFVEEVVRTRNKQDLVPILHRFSAYLETLFGQVNMRAVVADHPFEYRTNS